MGLAETARALGICGVNPGGTYTRIEIGSRQPDADMVERIRILTDGVVAAADMQAVRLAWLQRHRPEKFRSMPSPSAPPPSSPAAAGAAPDGLPVLSGAARNESESASRARHANSEASQLHEGIRP